MNEAGYAPASQICLIKYMQVKPFGAIRARSMKQMRFRSLLCLTFVGLWLGGKVSGQTILLEKAAEYLKKNNLKAAREAIELASKNDATKAEPRTWYLKGFVFKELYKQSPATTEDRETAVQALQKSLELDTKNIYSASANSALEYLYSTYYDEAIDLLNAKQFQKALAGLQKFIDFRAKTNPDGFYAEALYYAGSSSYSLGKNTEAIQYYEQSLQKGYKNPMLYDDLAQIYLSEHNSQKAVQVLEAGRKLYPNDPTLRISEINMYLQLKDYPKAERMIDEHLKANPKDTDAMMVAGTVYRAICETDTSKQEIYFEKQKTVYRKILAKEPDNFMANYNLGIAYYNRAVPLLNDKAPDLTITEFSKRLDYISALIIESKPYVEKAAQLSPQNVNSLKALSGIYHYLDEPEKFQQTQNKIKLLEKK